MNFITAQWSAPNNVKALTTTIQGGVSVGPYASNNLALHVGDNPAHALQNRERLRAKLNLLHEPAWLEQTHSSVCVTVEETTVRQADAAITRVVAQPLVILTGDCLPILLCNTQGSEIAAVHAGWQGLASGVIERTLDQMQSPADELCAWIGPSICQDCYEISDAIKSRFLERYPYSISAFRQRYANLAKIAELILSSHHVPAVFHAQICTFEQINACYSYRRNKQTGRMASLIYLNNPG